MVDSSDEEEPEYEVERLLSDDIVEGQIFYLVKWVGYPDEQCTWEPLESFNSDETIREWEQAKSVGDVLDDEFLTALQQRMDEFQGRQQESHEENEDYMDDGESDDEVVVVAPRPESASKKQKLNVASDNDTSELSVRIKTSGSPAPKKRKLFHQTLADSSVRSSAARPITNVSSSKFLLSGSQPLGRSNSTTSKIQSSTRGRAQASGTSKFPKAPASKIASEKTRNPPALSIKGPVMPSINRVGLKAGETASLTNPAGPAITINSSTSKSTKGVDRSEELRPLAGQRFRNLKHQNNARKKARNERAPDPSTLRLITATDLNVTTAGDTAHLLPLSTARADDSASLFIPESDPDEVKHAIPIADKPAVSSREPPLSNTDKSGGSSAVSPIVRERVEDIVQRLSQVIRKEPNPPIVRSVSFAVAVPVIDRLQPSDAVPYAAPTARHSNQGFPPVAEIVRAYNGLEWYKGDLVVDLSLGEPIGVVKLVGGPWHPIGTQIVSLKDGHDLKIDFPTENRFTRFEYDQSQPHHHGSIWSVEPFPHTKQAVDEFSDYLEKNDIAALWHHPKERLSMLIYSYEAKSWRDIGWQPARIGRPRLHVAFLRDLNRIVKKPIGPPITIPQSVPAAAVNSTPIEQQVQRQDTESESISRPRSRGDPSRARSRSRETSRSRDVSVSRDPRRRRNSSYGNVENRPGPSNKDSPADTPFQSPFDNHSTPASPKTPVTPFDGAMSIQRDDNYDLRLRALKANSTIPDLSIDFKSLTNKHVANPKIDKKRAYFFIAFTKTHEHEAVLLHQWLEFRSSTTHIFTASDEGGWKGFETRARGGVMAVIFFHAEAPNYHAFKGLGDLLSLENVQCHSLSFGPYSTTVPTAVAISPLFPRGSVFLVTESNITNTLDHSLFIMRYWLKEVRPGWKIMFRPRIRSYLRDKASREKEPVIRFKLLDLLVHIQSLIFDAETEIENQNSTTSANNKNGDRTRDEDTESLRGGENSGTGLGDDQVKAYIISPSSLPRYDDTGQDPQSIKRRDQILLEYFCGWAADRAGKYRRFWAFGREFVGSENCGHIHFEDDLDKFVEKYTKKVTDKAVAK